MARKISDRVTEQQLRDATGIHVGAEDQADAAARDAEAKRQQEIKDLEEGFAAPSVAHPTDKADSPGTVANQEGDAESPWESNVDDEPQLAGKKFNQRRKTLVAAGAGGAVAIILAFFTASSVFRVPSIMNGILGLAGEAVEEIVERRVERMIFTYLLCKGGAGSACRGFVVTGSPLSDLWATWRSNRLEDKIAERTGFRFEDLGDGRVRLVHDGRDVGTVRNYQELVDLSYRDALTYRELKKAVKILKPWSITRSGKLAKWLKLKYGVRRFGLPPEDKTKSKEENLEVARAAQLEAPTTATLEPVGDAMDCLTEDKCDAINDTGEPIDTTVNPDDPERAHTDSTGSSDSVADQIQEAGPEAAEDVARNGGSFTDKLMEKILAKVIGTATAKAVVGTIPFVGWIDFAATMYHISRQAINNDLAARLPAILAERGLGAVYTDWAGYGDQIKTGNMSALYIAALNAQLKGAETARASKFVFKGETNTGVPAEVRVNSNLTSPFHEAVKTMSDIQFYGGGFLLELWYQSIGRILSAGGEFLAWLASPLMNQFKELAASIFGENWEEELLKAAIRGFMQMFGIAVDPLATGAKMFNQLYVGADAAMNAYCKINLGCRALSAMFDPLLGASPASSGGLAGRHRPDMVGLSLHDRLFSMNEPYSLANSVFRAMPADSNPFSLVAATWRGVANLPSSLWSTFSSRGLAAPTAEERASIGGVRQYGATAEDLNQELAEQVRRELVPVCPDVDQETTFNVCQADLELTKAMMCWGSDCPEYQDGTSVGNPVSGQGDPRELASILLGKKVSVGATTPGISFVFPYAEQDLQTIASGGSITSCSGSGPGVILDTALLQVLVALSEKYNVGLGFFITQHGCDSGQHPLGRGIDIDAVDGHTLYEVGGENGDMGGIPAALAQTFMEDTARLMPQGRGGLGQNQCTPLRSAIYPPGVQSFPDRCHHFHVDTRQN